MECSKCDNSASDYLGSGSGGPYHTYGRYVGNCETGNKFQQAECSFECKVGRTNNGGSFNGHWETCFSAQCKGSDIWSAPRSPCCRAELHTAPHVSWVIYDGCC